MERRLIIEVRNETSDATDVRVTLEDAANGTLLYNRTISVSPDNGRRLPELERWYDQEIVVSATAGRVPPAQRVYDAGSLCGNCFVTVHVQREGITFSLGVAD